MKYLIIIPILSLIVSCNNSKVSEKDTNTGANKIIKVDTTAKLPAAEKILNQSESYDLDFIPTDSSIKRELTTQNYNDLVSDNLHDWVQYFSKLSGDFYIDDFENYQTDLLTPYQVDLGDNDFRNGFLELYNSYLKWSHDSLKAIDIYSYTYILEYNSTGNIIGVQDIDCQIAIIDLKQNKRIILETFGSAVNFHDSFWLNDDTIIVTNVSTSNGETFEPGYCMINLSNYLCYHYKLDTDLKLRNVAYNELIFKDIEFE